LFGSSRIKRNKYIESTAKLKRSSGYRADYFKIKKGLPLPITSSTLYFCPYCGKPMINKAKMHVDHIHSLRRAQYTKRLRAKYKTLPSGVNNISNLTACCPRCNRRKGKKGGVWVFLGKYGVYFMPGVWFINRLILISVIIFFIYIML